MNPRSNQTKQLVPDRRGQNVQLVEPSLWRMLEQCARELARLIVPLSCAGCAEPDHVLCPQCTAHFLDTPIRAEHLIPRLDGAPLSVWTCGLYAEPLNYVIMNWKDGRRFDVTKPLTAVLCNGAEQIAAQIAHQLTARDASPSEVDFSAPVTDGVVTDGVVTDGVVTDGVVTDGVDTGGLTNIVVVPLPSSSRSRRLRGFVPAEELAHGVVDGLILGLRTSDRGLSGNIRVSLGTGLKVNTRKIDQVGLDSRKRAKNLSGTLTASPLLLTQCYVASVIIFVDDLITTGATMREAMRVLPRQSRTLVAGISLCVTPARVIV